MVLTRKLRRLYARFDLTRDIRDPARAKEAEPLVEASGRPNAQDTYRAGLHKIRIDTGVSQGSQAESEMAVVAIHGLCDSQAHWNETHARLRHWLLDFLPQRTELYIFQYSSDIFFESSLRGLSEQAGIMLHQLDLLPVRPRILICHGMGGILAKKAICTAQRAYPRIFEQLRAILFLGTPHGPSELADLAAVLGKIVNSSHDSALRAERLRAIRSNAKALCNITRDFLNDVGDLDIFSFYEALPTAPMNAVIVDKAASTLGKAKAHQVELCVNHPQICQMAGEDPGHYREVAAILQGIISSIDPAPDATVLGESKTRRSPPSIHFDNTSSRVVNQGYTRVGGDQNIFNVMYAPAIIQSSKIDTTHPHPDASGSSSASNRSFDESEWNFLSKLSPVPLHGRLSDVDEKIEGTLDWIFLENAYDTWITSPLPCILLVSGNAGCGKSVLASHIARSLSADRSSANVVCRYFFDGTTTSQADACTLLRSLVYQMLAQRPKLLRIATKRLVEQPQLLTEKEPLFNLFRDLATHPRMRSVIIIIDAIDESKRIHQEWMLERFVKLLRSDESLHIKFLVTGRPTSPATKTLLNCTAPFSQLVLDSGGDMLKEDIRIFIQKHVDRLVQSGICREVLRPVLMKSLLEKSEGTYLWVALACSLLHQRNVLNKKDVGEISSRLPPSLTQMYDLLLQSIPQEERKLAANALRLMRVCTRHLTFEEINIVLTLDSTHSRTATINQDSCLFDAWSLECLLNGLVKLSDNTFTLIHHTLKEHLTGRNKTEQSVMDDFSCDPSTDHQQIAESCMRYLLFDDLEADLFENISPDTPTFPETRLARDPSDAASDPDSYLGALFQEPDEVTERVAATVATRHHLFDYAARNWTFHFSQCQSENSRQLQHLAMRLYNNGTPRNWLKYLFAVDENIVELPRDSRASVLACFFGHHTILHELLVRDDESWDPTALYWASKNGHIPCIKVLLSAKFPLSRWSAVGGFTPLCIAAAYGRTECVLHLLDGGYSANECATGGRTALCLAAVGAHCDTISAFLKEGDVDANAPDHLGATPLFWASIARSPSAVSLLLAVEQTDPLKLDKHGRDALSWACEYGATEVVEVLLTRIPREKRNVKDVKGQTSVMYAVRSGSLGTVRALLGRISSSSIVERDQDGRNAISWAAQLANNQILVHLLERNHSGANVEDSNGWTPLAWTLDPPERTTNAATLLHYVSKDLNNASGLAFFLLALSWRSYNIARLLISANVFDVNTESAAGRTALSYAAENGHTDLVRQLLDQHGIKIDAIDRRGNTPYSLAASNNHVGVCRLLSGGP